MRGKWTTSYRDKGKAQYQADQIARALSMSVQATQEQLQKAWQDGYRAGWEAHRAATTQR